MTDVTLYNPADADDAHAAWRANCGPCSLAALLARPVMDLRELFPRYPRQPWTNPTHMREALEKLGVRHAGANNRDVARGLFFVQWDGPWCQPGVPVTVAYRNTHWIARDAGMVYDVNAREWVTPGEWENEIVPLILAEVPRSTGWWVRSGIEVPLTR